MARLTDRLTGPIPRIATRREKLDELFERMDEDGNEGVSQEEFITMFQHIATKCVFTIEPN